MCYLYQCLTLGRHGCTIAVWWYIYSTYAPNMLTHVLQSHSHVRLRAAPADLLFAPNTQLLCCCTKWNMLWWSKHLVRFVRLVNVYLRSLVIAWIYLLTERICIQLEGCFKSAFLTWGLLPWCSFRQNINNHWSHRGSCPGCGPSHEPVLLPLLWLHHCDPKKKMKHKKQQQKFTNSKTEQHNNVTCLSQF